MIQKILLLGDQRLYQVSAPVLEAQRDQLAALEEDLRDTMLEFRRVHRVGRAIAAPQIGVFKRVIYMNAPEMEAPILLVNPRLEFPDQERMELWDDCMSFPGLLVRLKRYRKCVVRFLDRDWKEQTLVLEGDLSELIQHEYDHLDGILAVDRAESSKDLAMREALP